MINVIYRWCSGVNMKRRLPYCSKMFALCSMIRVMPPLSPEGPKAPSLRRADISRARALSPLANSLQLRMSSSIGMGPSFKKINSA